MTSVERFRADEAECGSTAAAIERIQKRIEWLWANCRIVYYPPAQPGQPTPYPVEHTTYCNKDMRGPIEAAMERGIR